MSRSRTPKPGTDAAGGLAGAVITAAPPSWKILGIGSALAVVQVSTLGQPFEVIKTHMAANRGDNLRQSVRKTWARGGFTAFYQGLIPWAWFEAATKGGILLLCASATERRMLRWMPERQAIAGAAGGIIGGLVQTYTVVGFTTTMKTVEITRNKSMANGTTPPSTWAVCRNIYRMEGIRGLNKGVNAVALRQVTAWSSRISLTRLSEGFVRSVTGKHPGDKISASEKILSSCAGGALSCWNQPFEVLRIEMQSAIPSELRQAGHRPTMIETARFILQRNGIVGLFRGVTPRVALGASVTTFMVAGGDLFNEWFA